MSSPRLAPWLIPETISSGLAPSRPRSAKRTQSTGVPSVAKPRLPSSNSTSCTQSGERVVMLRAVALRFESGAITCTATSGTPLRPRRSAFRPLAWMPSSLVIRTRTTPILRAARLPLFSPAHGRHQGHHHLAVAVRRHRSVLSEGRQIALVMLIPAPPPPLLPVGLPVEGLAFERPLEEVEMNVPAGQVHCLVPLLELLHRAGESEDGAVAVGAKLPAEGAVDVALPLEQPRGIELGDRAVKNRRVVLILDPRLLPNLFGGLGVLPTQHHAAALPQVDLGLGQPRLELLGFREGRPDALHRMPEAALEAKLVCPASLDQDAVLDRDCRVALNHLQSSSSRCFSRASRRPAQ